MSSDEDSPRIKVPDVDADHQSITAPGEIAETVMMPGPQLEPASETGDTGNGLITA